jgi:hypothetical protein
VNDMMTQSAETLPAYQAVIADIDALNWAGLDGAGISAVALAYYYFSIQFRENLQVAARLNPTDPAFALLVREECHTANLSPWPDVALAGEKMDHDEFMRRVLRLGRIDPVTEQRVAEAGLRYLERTRVMDDLTRAMSITSYEDGGLETVFKAMLRCPVWDTALLQGFAHFLRKHIGFDSAPDGGHGALIRHSAPDDRIVCLWQEFHDILVLAAPHLKPVAPRRG